MDALAGEAGPVWVGWLYAEANTDLDTLRELAAAGLIHLAEAEIWRDPLAGKEFVADKAPALTEDQARVWVKLSEGLVERWRKWRSGEWSETEYRGYSEFRPSSLHHSILHPLFSSTASPAAARPRSICGRSRRR